MTGDRHRDRAVDIVAPPGAGPPARWPSGCSRRRARVRRRAERPVADAGGTFCGQGGGDEGALHRARWRRLRRDRGPLEPGWGASSAVISGRASERAGIARGQRMARLALSHDTLATAVVLAERAATPSGGVRRKAPRAVHYGAGADCGRDRARRRRPPKQSEPIAALDRPSGYGGRQRGPRDARPIRRIRAAGHRRGRQGNNGNDGRVAAGHLARRGARVTLVDAADRRRRCPAPISSSTPPIGTGYRGDYEAPDAAGPRAGSGLPTGIDAGTGVAGDGAVRAASTMTFGSLKPGMLFNDGPEVWQVTTRRIGLPSAHVRPA